MHGTCIQIHWQFDMRRTWEIMVAWKNLFPLKWINLLANIDAFDVLCSHKKVFANRNVILSLGCWQRCYHVNYVILERTREREREQEHCLRKILIDIWTFCMYHWRNGTDKLAIKVIFLRSFGHLLQFLLLLLLAFL